MWLCMGQCTNSHAFNKNIDWNNPMLGLLASRMQFWSSGVAWAMSAITCPCLRGSHCCENPEPLELPVPKILLLSFVKFIQPSSSLLVLDSAESQHICALETWCDPKAFFTHSRRNVTCPVDWWKISFPPHGPLRDYSQKQDHTSMFINPITPGAISVVKSNVPVPSPFTPLFLLFTSYAIHAFRPSSFFIYLKWS